METLSSTINGLLQLSPPVILGVVLWIIGRMMKAVPFIQNWSIPFVVSFLGAITYPFVAEIGEMSYNVKLPWLLNVLFGFAIGASPVLVDQMKQQWGNFKSAKAADEDTKFIHRDPDAPKPEEPPTPKQP